MDFTVTPGRAAACFSPLLLADHLLTLAQQAEHLGLTNAAGRLVVLAHAVMDERPPARLH